FLSASLSKLGHESYHLDEFASRTVAGQNAEGATVSNINSSSYHGAGSETFVRGLLQVDAHGSLSVDGTDTDLGSLEAVGDVSLDSQTLAEVGSESFHSSSFSSQSLSSTSGLNAQSLQINRSGSGPFSRRTDAVRLGSGTSDPAAAFSLSAEGGAPRTFTAAGSFLLSSI